MLAGVLFRWDNGAFEVTLGGHFFLIFVWLMAVVLVLAWNDRPQGPRRHR